MARQAASAAIFEGTKRRPHKRNGNRRLAQLLPNAHLALSQAALLNPSTEPQLRMQYFGQQRMRLLHLRDPIISRHIFHTKPFRDLWRSYQHPQCFLNHPRLKRLTAAAAPRAPAPGRAAPASRSPGIHPANGRGCRPGRRRKWSACRSPRRSRNRRSPR